MNHPYRAAVVSLLGLLCLSSALHGQGYLRTSGKIIVNDDGNVLLRGLGLGGWLVPEGYMLQTGKVDSPTKIRNAVVALVGASNADNFFAEYRKNFVTKKDIDYLKSCGFNSIRLPFHYQLLTPADTPDTYVDEGFALIDTVVSWCKANRMYVILDLHCAPGAQNTGNISDSDGEAYLWLDTAYQTRTVNLWRKIAERYANEPWVGGYDLINETNYTLNPNNLPLMMLMKRITAAIRTVDTKHIVFIEGNNYATNFSGLTPAWDANMVYSFHKYWNPTTVGTIQYLLDLRNATNCPLWLGESGENNNAWFTDCIKLMEDNNIGWAWWTLKKIGSPSDFLNVPTTPGYKAVSDYFSNGGTKPSVSAATSALMDIAARLAFDRCEKRTDVVDALFRQPFSSETKPYAANSIPGTILAAHYDLGRNGSAYRDWDDLASPASQPDNQGYEFRNDGVDMQVCSDAGIPYNVGWTLAGEWMKYTVDVRQSGVYSVAVRASSQSGGGAFQIRVDEGASSASVGVASTGGWQTWSTVYKHNIALTQGTHALYFEIASSGFNIASMTFTRTGDLPTLVGDDDGLRPHTFALGQNFPNPFNGATVIAYTLPSASDVCVTITDALGRIVGTVRRGREEAGPHTVRWSPGDLPSGVYYYRLSAGAHTDIRRMLYLK